MSEEYFHDQIIMKEIYRTSGLIAGLLYITDPSVVVLIALCFGVEFL